MATLPDSQVRCFKLESQIRGGHFKWVATDVMNSENLSAYQFDMCCLKREIQILNTVLISLNRFQRIHIILTTIRKPLIIHRELFAEKILFGVVEKR